MSRSCDCQQMHKLCEQQSAEIEDLRFQLDELREILVSDPVLDQFAFVLSPREREVLGLLIRRGCVSIESMLAVIYGNSLHSRDPVDPRKSIHVFICRIRKKLANWPDVEINTVYGFGYQLSPESHRALQMSTKLQEKTKLPSVGNEKRDNKKRRQLTML